MSTIKEENGLIRSKQKDMGVYMIAIAQGALIGVVGFLLMGYLITYLGKTAPVLAAAPEGIAKKPDVQSFSKELMVKTKGCSAPIELLAEQLAKLDDQNFILSEAKARKFKSDEIEKLQKLLNIVSEHPSKALFTLNSTSPVSLSN